MVTTLPSETQSGPLVSRRQIFELGSADRLLAKHLRGLFRRAGGAWGSLDGESRGI